MQKTPDDLDILSRAEMRARIRVLELENLRQAARIDAREEELRCAAARERHLARRLAGNVGGAVGREASGDW